MLKSVPIALNPFLPFPNFAAGWLVFLLVFTGVSRSAGAANPALDGKVVTYEAFGAVGDGVADDLPAICKAHAEANQLGLPVRSKPGATYHLGRQALTAIIATDTNWGTSRFIIDDSQGVEDSRRALFEVRSMLKPVPLKIDHLARGQTKLDARPPADCLVYVENKNRRLFIRKGPNRNDGTPQKEVFVLRRDGSILGDIDWDYDVITLSEAHPIDPQPLFLRGGIFTNIANRTEKDTGYWSRNISITRSRTVVEGVTHRVTGEGEHGQPYGGFLSARQCANIILRDCVVDGRKTYKKIGNAGVSVPMGTYGYHANLVVDFRMIGCRMGNDIHDRSRWGVVAANFMKDFLVENCVLSRVDVHMGVSGSYVIRGSTIGHAGINAIGRGQLIVEDSTLHGGRMVSFREDYGSTWDGEVLIRNCRWLPPMGKKFYPVMFGMSNDGSHGFGYPCSMPRHIKIDGLFVDDALHPEDYRGIRFFGDPIGASRDNRPFPYALTETLDVRGIKTASGLAPRVSDNLEFTNNIRMLPDGEK